jgi:altronate hydrolase
MLFQINSAATEQNAVILLHSKDKVAVVRVRLSPAQSIEAQSAVLTVVNAIPAGHKVALEPIHAGQPVRLYRA